jgi:hypothetical protein
MDLLTLLKLDLSVRADNNLWGSGLGGNPSELFYLLNKNTTLFVDAGVATTFQEDDENFSIICGEEVKLIPLRKSLTQFIGYLEEISFGELVHNIKNNIDVNNNSQDILDLRDCMLLSDKLSDCLYSKEEKRTAIRDAYHNDVKSLMERYSKYIEYNDHMFNRLEGGLARKLDKDPIWGAQKSFLKEKSRKLIVELLTADEIQLMEEINKFSPHITFLCARLLIGVEWLMDYPIDKYINNFVIPSDGFKVK